MAESNRCDFSADRLWFGAHQDDHRQAMIGKVNSSVNVSGVDIVVGIPNIDSCGEKAKQTTEARSA
jgi:hypothetical protein